jgi:hypothetical protein
MAEDAAPVPWTMDLDVSHRPLAHASSAAIWPGPLMIAVAAVPLFEPEGSAFMYMAVQAAE